VARAPTQKEGRDVRIEFKTNDYQFTWGKAPRGFGPWAFEIIETIDTEDTPKDLLGPIWVYPSCSYADAKREVKKIIRTKIKATDRGAVIVLNVLT
jgi:hypothetical protein